MQVQIQIIVVGWQLQHQPRAKIAGLSTFIYVKTGTWPNFQQLALGEVGLALCLWTLPFVFASNNWK
jgi:hypothetical protein